MINLVKHTCEVVCGGGFEGTPLESVQGWTPWGSKVFWNLLWLPCCCVSLSSVGSAGLTFWPHEECMVDQGKRMGVHTIVLPWLMIMRAAKIDQVLYMIPTPLLNGLVWFSMGTTREMHWGSWGTEGSGTVSLFPSEYVCRGGLCPLDRVLVCRDGVWCLPTELQGPV